MFMIVVLENLRTVFKDHAGDAPETLSRHNRRHFSEASRLISAVSISAGAD